MTKEPSKDFREAVREIIEQVGEPIDDPECISPYKATTRILAICKEMLVPPYDHSVGPFPEKWNDARDYLLKQLGEDAK